ncbi:hypothetical protein [Luteimicrobium subarcticum]|uniref:Uncharacterized protein n=1 Tax=Luteimicrobium subarcticum TaxID=620910 RepID=A0A2M8WS46_9MICO|nr:hypothetical protein [Luteimicrobium subarcticum]PJI93738.1 hypothetical protein CLV34_1213 [Luteimicrobium subarcticum]
MTDLPSEFSLDGLPALRAVTAAAPLDQARHLLGVSDEVRPDEVETLAVSRFPEARWEVAPVGIDLISPPDRWARTGEPGVLRLTPTTVLIGPCSPWFSDGLGSGLPEETAYAFDVACVRERGEPPYPGGGDRDGLNRAFPVGLPVATEGEVVTWLVAAARRLCGAVRFDVGGSVSRDVVVAPDPDATVDLVVFTDVWLDPEAAQALVREVEPSASLALDGVEWGGPPQAVYELAERGALPLTQPQVAAIQAEADARDMAALSQPMSLDGYALVVDLGQDGVVVVEAGADPLVPPVLAGLPWTLNGAITYRVRWEPPDLEASQQEQPPLGHVLARGRALPVVVGVASALHAAVGGEIADEDGFLVEPVDLS